MITGSIVTVLVSLEQYRDATRWRPEPALLEEDGDEPLPQPPARRSHPGCRPDHGGLGQGGSDRPGVYGPAVARHQPRSSASAGDQAPTLPRQGTVAVAVVLLALLIFLVFIIFLLTHAIRSHVLTYASLAANLMLGILAITVAIVLGTAAGSLTQVTGLLLGVAFFIVYLASLAVMILE